MKKILVAVFMSLSFGFAYAMPQEDIMSAPDVEEVESTTYSMKSDVPQSSTFHVDGDISTAQKRNRGFVGFGFELWDVDFRGLSRSIDKDLIELLNKNVVSLKFDIGGYTNSLYLAISFGLGGYGDTLYMQNTRVKARTNYFSYDMSLGRRCIETQHFSVTPYVNLKYQHYRLLTQALDGNHLSNHLSSERNRWESGDDLRFNQYVVCLNLMAEWRWAFCGVKFFGGYMTKLHENVIIRTASGRLNNALQLKYEPFNFGASFMLYF